MGRRPNGKDIGAEKAGVTVNERGWIPVDRQMRTNVPHIFAIGDIVGEPMLAHKATHEAKLAAEVIAGMTHHVWEARTIPSVAYTDPEVAWPAGKCLRRPLPRVSVPVQSRLRRRAGAADRKSVV